MASLYVAIYRPRPRSGNVQHWALFVDEHGNGSTIYEVIGDPGEFEFNKVDNTRPDRSQHFRRNIHVTDIDSPSDIQQLHQLIPRQPIRNDIALWNCHQWVLDVLEALHDEFLIEDYEYGEAEQNLEAILDR